MNKAKLKALAKLQHWKRQWKDKPELMKANLDALIASRKALKARKGKVVSQVIQRLPKTFQASKSKQLMSDALLAQGLQPDPGRLKRLRTQAVRYGLLTYDAQKKCWIVMANSQFLA
jgi:hypothetical protein